MPAPSQTVENYLKNIYLAQLSLATTSSCRWDNWPQRCVVPGTATTMVKALAESSLAHYEPTPACG